MVYLFIYVLDDIVISGSNEGLVQVLIDQLGKAPPPYLFWPLAPHQWYWFTGGRKSRSASEEESENNTWHQFLLGSHKKPGSGHSCLSRGFSRSRALLIASCILWNPSRTTSTRSASAFVIFSNSSRKTLNAYSLLFHWLNLTALDVGDSMTYECNPQNLIHTKEIGCSLQCGRTSSGRTYWNPPIERENKDWNPPLQVVERIIPEKGNKA